MKLLICLVVITGGYCGIALAAVNSTACAKLPNVKIAANCCDMPSIFAQPIVQNCEARNPPSPGLNVPPSYRRCCVSECVLNATGILDFGQVNALKAIAVLEKSFKVNETQLIIRQAIKECVADIAEKAIYMALEIGTHPPPAEIRFCHPRSGVFTACVNGYVYQHCPASRWMNSTECLELKDYAERCESLPLFI